MLVSVLEDADDLSSNGNKSITNTQGRTARQSWRAADRLSEADVRDLVDRYQNGATQGELATRYGISRGAVRRLLQEQGVELRTRGLTPEQVDQAVRLYSQGWSLARIGERLGVDAGTVHARLRELGVRMRDTHGRER